MARDPILFSPRTARTASRFPPDAVGARTDKDKGVNVQVLVRCRYRVNYNCTVIEIMVSGFCNKFKTI